MKSPPPRKQEGQAKKPRRLTGEVLDVATMAALLGVTEKCIRARVTRGLVPHRRWAGRVVFIRAEVMAFLSGLEGVSVDQALANIAQRAARNIAHEDPDQLIAS